MVTKTVARALVELKTQDKKITDRINKSIFDSITVNSKNTTDNFNPSADYNAVQDLISHRAKLKSAIMHSNMITKVTVAGINMSVLDAIELKSSIEYQRALRDKMLRDTTNVEHKLIMNAQSIKETTDRTLSNLYTTQQPTQTDADMIITQYEKIYKATRTLSVDFDITTKLVELTDKITAFIEDVDVALSESNAVTLIEI